MTSKFIIDGSLMSLNEYVRRCRGNKFAGAQAKALMDKIVTAYIKQQLQGIAYSDKVEIDFLWVCANKRQDPDNICFAKKFILDALVKCGIIPNDNWRYINGFTDSFDIDNDNPRIEVTISEV